MTNPAPKKKEQKPAPKTQDREPTFDERIKLLFSI